jgi:hypothetical protein
MTLASHADLTTDIASTNQCSTNHQPRFFVPSPHSSSLVYPVTIPLFVADWATSSHLQRHLDFSSRHAAATPHQGEVNATLDILHVLPSRLSCSSLSASLTLPPHHHQCAPLIEVQTSIAQHEAPLQRHRSCAFCNCSFSYNNYRQDGQIISHAVSRTRGLH